jgi:hypothetical protein
VTFIPLTVVRVRVTVVLKAPTFRMTEQLLGTFEKFGGLAAVRHCYTERGITAAHCRKSMNFSNGPRIFLTLYFTFCYVKGSREH